MAQWNGIPAHKNIRKENTFKDCVNTDNNSFFISEHAYSFGYGWDTDKYPVLAVRKGRSDLGVSGQAKTRLLTNYGNTHLLRAVGTKLQYYNGSSWTDIAGTFAEQDWDACNFDIGGPVLMITNGTDVPRYWDGTTLKNNSSMPKGKFIASDNRRVYTAGVSGDLDSIYYCAFQNGLNWTAPENSGIVNYYTPNGGPITGLASFEGQIYAFKKDSFCQIFHTGDARITHRLVEASNDIGCVSHKTIVEVGPYLFWLGYKDVFICAGGAAVSIGGEVKEILQTINEDHISEACAWSDDYKYYLCIPTGDSTINNIELVYDTHNKKWHIRNINLGGMRYGASLNNVPYGGWEDGQTFRLNHGYTDAGNPIPYLVDSRPYDEGLGEAEKEYYELHIQGFIDTDSHMNVSVSVEDRGETFSQIDTLTPSMVSQNKNIIVPMDTVPLTHWVRYRLEGEGYVEINKVQRYARVQPVQH